MGLAPTTSTTMQMALGDALAVALLTRRGFTAADFRRFHPGGRLGARLRRVRELMHSGDAVPLAPPDMPMDRALLLMTEKRFGCLGVIDADGRLVGIVTDGDLRRAMGPDLLARQVGEIMTASPRTIGPDALAAEALHVMNAPRAPDHRACSWSMPDGRPRRHPAHPRPAARGAGMSMSSAPSIDPQPRRPACRLIAAAAERMHRMPSARHLARRRVADHSDQVAAAGRCAGAARDDRAVAGTRSRRRPDPARRSAVPAATVAGRAG